MSGTALVTGGAGFIGSHLVDALLGLGHQVMVLDDLSSGKRESLNRGCRLVEGDIRDRSSVNHCVAGKDVVFHLAAFTSLPESLEDPDSCYDINVSGTRNLVEQACLAGVSKFVFSSTSAVYPDYPDTPRSEDTPPDPQTPYAQSKLQGEALLQQFNRDERFSFVALRYFNVYGPRQDPHSQYAAVIPSFLSASRLQQTLTIYGSGRQTRDFVYVDDVVGANLAAMDSQACGVYNVGTSLPVSILSLAETIINLTGSSSGYAFAPPRRGDALSSTADISLALASLGWRPWWSLESGLAETIGRQSA